MGGAAAHDDRAGGRRPSAVSRGDRRCPAQHVRSGRRSGGRLDDRGDRPGRQCQRHRSGPAGPAHAGHERGQGRAHPAPPPAGHSDRGHLRARRQHGGAAVLRCRRHRLYPEVPAAPGSPAQSRPSWTGAASRRTTARSATPAPRKSTRTQSCTTPCAAGSNRSPTSNGRCWS